jgi:hypothetical protein
MEGDCERLWILAEASKKREQVLALLEEFK